MSEINIPVFKLPPYVRESLSIPQGILYVTRTRERVISGLKADITIGDIVSQRHYSEIKVIDHKTRRKTVEHLTTKETTQIKSIVYNPAGSISIHSITISMTKVHNIFVKGEEDLVVIPYLKSSYNTILYGQPGSGIVAMKSNRLLFLKILKASKPSIVKVSVST
ncbi:MAG: DUF359 domain-containing protein [Desulfurococcaceae archaeon]